MTYLIQSRQTREYFQEGKWTLDLGWAEEFPDTARAIATCLRHELRNVELVLQFGFESGRHYHLNLDLPQWLFLG